MDVLELSPVSSHLPPHSFKPIHYATLSRIHQHLKKLHHAAPFTSNKAISKPAACSYPEQTHLTDGRQPPSIRVIKCQCPIVKHLPNDLPPAAPHCVINLKTTTGKAARDLIHFPDESDTRLSGGRQASAEIKVAVINLHATPSSTSDWLLLINWTRGGG